ncbi:MAG: hypothetical protein GXY55_21140 [Phycisphaerae bacterium]|nr:hypothetical protein [Phycisphaerae bacterium]
MTSVSSTLSLHEIPTSGVRVGVRAGTVLLATIWAVVFCVSLSRSLFDPIGYDQAFWQYVTERVMAGERMYVDVWDQNAPGVLGIHALSTWLVGRSPLALRVFDAGWQLVTMALLVLLVGRDSRRWGVGWLAATLYALAYYSGGYVHTAQRDGFAALPMLLALHVVSISSRRAGAGGSLLAHVVAGAMGLAICAIKPPLGLIFGVLWCWTLAEAWLERGEGWRAWRSWLGLNAGFLLAAGAGAALMTAWGWWDGFVRAMTRADVPGYIQGPLLMRQLFIAVLPIAVVLAGAVAWLLYEELPTGRRWNLGADGRRGRLAVGLFLTAWIKAVAVAAALLSIWVWPAWQSLLPIVGGLMLPAGGAVLIRAWGGRSRTWRLVALTGGAVFTAITLQGQFYLYHFPPLLACLAYLAANELAAYRPERRRSAVQPTEELFSMDAALISRSRSRGRFSDASARHRAWTLVCLACVALLAGHAWGGKMTAVSRHPRVLGAMTLDDHYDRITRHKPRYPLYSTTRLAAQRVRELTGPTDPIACFINEPRLYYLAERPAAHRLIIPNQAFRPLFDEFLLALDAERPPVILARVPESLRGGGDLLAIHRAVFDEAESFFGPRAKLLRGIYRVSETVGDICILQPTGEDVP